MISIGTPSRRRSAVIVLAGAAAASLSAFAGMPAGDGGAIPKRPEELSFRALEFTPPQASAFRQTLSDGTPVYMAPSKEFPLVNLVFSFKGGDFLDPPDMVGLAGMTGREMRDGGTTTIKPADLDEQLDFLATQAGVSVGDVTTTASMNCLAGNFDESLKLFIDMLRNPGFDPARLEVARGQYLEKLKTRNDDAGTIQGREWPALLYGRDHFEAAEPTEKGVRAISPDAMWAMHKRIFHPGNLIIAVTGDFDPATMKAKLEKALAGWERGEPVSDPPPPSATLEPGVYHVQKDIPQGKVLIGCRGIQRDDPDFFPLLVMNEILGGGGFTSRIVQSVRSNEGLAYSAFSRNGPKVWYPGEFQAGFQSKNATCALATRLIFDELNRIRTEPVTDEELATAKRGFIETFPRQFESKPAVLGIFVSDEWTKRPEGYWTTFRDRVNAVSAADVQRVAQKYLDPSRMAILVVGDWKTIAPGDPTGRAKMADFFGGKVTHLPLRDPMTMEPLPEQPAAAPAAAAKGG